jgi:hypothetical protein
MTSGFLSSVGFGVIRVVAVIAVLVLVMSVIAVIVTRHVAHTRRARQGVFLGLSGTGLIFVAFVAWTWLQSIR